MSKADAVPEFSGSESGLTAALAAARTEGTVVVGRSFTCVDEFAEVIGLLADGVLRVADLTSELASSDGATQAR